MSLVSWTEPLPVGDAAWRPRDDDHVAGVRLDATELVPHAQVAEEMRVPKVNERRVVGDIVFRVAQLEFA